MATQPSRQAHYSNLEHAMGPNMIAILPSKLAPLTLDHTPSFQLPALPAEALKEQKGVDAYWYSWPGVDMTDAAPTIIYLHGGK